MGIGDAVPEGLDFAQALADNLKMLNAKERDHLMRWAYLGEGGDYTRQGSARMLAPAMTWALHGLLELSPAQKVVFAAMDYHLTWIYAALLYACGRVRPGGAGGPVERLVRASATGTLLPMDGQQGAQPGAGEASTYWPVRSGNGSHQDIDLLVVFSDGVRTVLAFVEAKGDSAFHSATNRRQVARKMARLDQILHLSGAEAQEGLSYHLVLASPDPDPGFNTMEGALGPRPVDPGSHGDRVHVVQRLQRGLNAGTGREGAADLKRKRFEAFKCGLEVELAERLRESGQNKPEAGFASRIGQDVRWLQLTGFPQDARKVERQSEAEGGTHWRIKARQQVSGHGGDIRGFLGSKAAVARMLEAADQGRPPVEALGKLLPKSLPDLVWSDALKAQVGHWVKEAMEGHGYVLAGTSRRISDPDNLFRSGALYLRQG